MNSSTRKRRDPRMRIAFVFCLFMVPLLVWAQDTTNKKPAKPAPAAPAPTRSAPPPAQPQTVRTPPQSPPAQPQGRGTTQYPPQQPQGRGPTQYPPSQPQGRGPVAQPRPFNQPGAPRQPMGDPGPNRPPARPGPAARPFTPPVGTNRSQRPDGTAIISHPDGRKWEVGSNGQATHFSKPGMDVRFGHDGRPSLIRDDKRGITVSRAPNGVRQVVSVRPDGARVVSYGMNRGYVERQVRPGYVQRTYVAGGRQYVTVYRTYSYNGMVYQRYVPAVYYQPRFYVWAATPWAAPVSYAWGWNAEPWYGYYPGYFTPAPSYSNAALWLTDYVIAENLKLAYENQQQNAQGAPPQTDEQSAPLSPVVKLAIAQEVRQRLAAEQMASTQPVDQSTSAGAPPPVAPPPALDPTIKVLIVSSNIEVAVAGGSTCALTPGDFIERTDDRISNDNTVTMRVTNGKAGDCPSNTITSIDVATLQEMHNAFLNQLDTGLNKLATSQGTGGIPSGPPPGAFSSRDGQGRADLNSEASLIQQQQQSANQADLEARLASSGGGQQ